MKKEFNNPIIEVIEINAEDIIKTSLQSGSSQVGTEGEFTFSNTIEYLFR